MGRSSDISKIFSVYSAVVGSKQPRGTLLKRGMVWEEIQDMVSAGLENLESLEKVRNLKNRSGSL